MSFKSKFTNIEEGVKYIFKGEVQDIKSQFLDKLKKKYGNTKIIDEEGECTYLESSRYFIVFCINKDSISVRITDDRVNKQLSKDAKSFGGEKIHIENNLSEDNIYVVSFQIPILVAPSEAEIEKRVRKIINSTSLMQIVLNSTPEDLVSYFLDDEVFMRDYQDFKNKCDKLDINKDII